MAISLAAAAIGSAVIGAGASAISGAKNAKAIKRSTAAQTAANDKSIALQQEARNQNIGFQQPFYNTGLAANNRINALLGLGVPQQSQVQQQFGQPSIRGQYNTPGYGGQMVGRGGFQGPAKGFGPEQYSTEMYNETPTGYGQQDTMQTNALGDAQQAFGDWRDNTGYQFRFNEGIRAIDAGAPVRNSGATLKARQQYGQNIGSQEFYNYLGALTGQQQVGTGAANALSGVNTTYANNATNIAQNQGQNLANSAVARANNSNNTLNGITSSFTNVLGTFAGGMPR